MKTITNDQLAAMMAEQDAAAKTYWAYPDQDWQISFQASWLLGEIGADQAIDDKGLLYGADRIEG